MSFSSSSSAIHVNRKRFKHKYCFKWIELFLSALFPIIFGIFTVVFTIQQDSIARANRGQDQALADELRKQIVYDSFINDISKSLLRREFNRSDLNSLRDIRVKTLNALRQVDSKRKREIILFLYENELIRRNNITTETLLNIDQGDLSGIRFIRSSNIKCQLDNLHLPGVLASNLTFEDCRLPYAQFDGASMVGSKFIRSNLFSSKFVDANLTDALFYGNNMRNLNLSGATLVRAKIYYSRVEKVDFTNADLLDSDLNIDQIIQSIGEKSNIFFNTRFPNGSFSIIDSSQLIKDNSAEQMCTSEITPWDTASGFEKIIATSGTSSPVAPASGSCLFKCFRNSRALQTVNTQRFLLLIDSGQAWYNLSAHFGCFSRDQQARVYVRLDFSTEQDVDITYAQIEANNSQSSLHFQHQIGLIPVGTREFDINIGADIEGSSALNVDEPYCLIDDINMFIFKRQV